MKILSLFSGIGGLDLACESVFGGVTAAQVEQSPHCRDVLARHFPRADRSVVDVLDLDGIGGLSSTPWDLICGGFPCQDIAACGTGQGLQGARSGLFFAMTAIAERLRPTWIVVENSPLLFSKHRAAVESELTRIGYGSTWSVISAEAVGAPHKRLRAFAVCKRGAQHVGEVERDQPVRGYRRWPTPTASDGNSAGGRSDESNACKPGVSLTDAVRVDRPKIGRNWSTPTTQDAKNNAGPSQLKRQTTPLNVQAGGALNPEFVEALMGFPVGWTNAAGAGQRAEAAGAPFCARYGAPAHAWESPKTVPSRSVPRRVARIKSLGNSACPPQAVEALRRALDGPKQATFWDLL